ncbi:MAG: short-chain dehydrogenase/reductase, partial [Frankiales bacterium]|nr:short-chain dehydrogenase/reductase [Frankiales bacterium]
MDLGIKGKGFLVVGGTAGMGLATARLLAAEGADLALVGRDADRCGKVAADLADEHGVHVVAVPADTSMPDSAEAVLAAAVAGLPDLAGVAVFTGIEGHLPDTSPDDVWELAFHDVFMGTVRVLRAAVPHLVARGGGTIVTTSAYGIHDPSVVRIPYGAMKASIATYTKALAKNYGKDGIRANCIAPGVIETDALTAIRKAMSDARGLPYESALETLMAGEWNMHVALARPGLPQEVADLAAFLLSDRAAYLTGA